jgi:hypothetical protein
MNKDILFGIKMISSHDSMVPGWCKESGILKFASYKEAAKCLQNWASACSWAKYIIEPIDHINE